MKLYGKVEGVKLIEHISSGLDLCTITIDFDEPSIFGDYNELLGYIGKDVEYDTRVDMYHGQQLVVVANLANVYTVQTLDRVENIRLIPKDAEVRNVCNFDIRGLKYGDYESLCIGFLTAYEVGSSDKSCWIDCTVIDKCGRAFTLRIFTNRVEGDIDAEEIISDLVGHYVQFNISFTKYGYQTSKIELVNVPVTVSPEVETAIAIIRSAVADDDELQSYMRQFDFIEHLKNVIDYEIGYHLVRIASEISMISMLDNISTLYDKKELIRAAIVSRGYLLPSKTKFSHPVLNITKLMRSDLKTDRELILMLDPMAEEDITPNGAIYQKISVFVNDINEERRGVNTKQVIDREGLKRVVGHLV